MYRTFLIALGLAVSLAGCSTGQSPAKTAFELRAAYDAAVLAPASNYAQLPTCPTNAPVCKQADVVIQLQKADAAASVALDSLETLVRSNPKIDATFALQAAQAAINAATSVINIYGIGKLTAAPASTGGK